MTSPHNDSTLLYDDPTQQLLAISPELDDEVWQDSQAFSAPGDRRRAYINRLCLKVVLPWLAEELEANATPFPQEKSLASIWEVVGGFAVEVKGKRLVIVPTETADLAELRVPQEWVEIPSWSGDYYLAVQVNPEDRWVQVWGYATHAMLKERGSCDRRDRAYSLAEEEIVRDLSLLTLACEGYIEEETRSPLEALTLVLADQAENLLQRLGNPQKAFPRLEIPFLQWGALLEQEEWRDRLYHLRQGQVMSPVNLMQWFEKQVEAGWQLIDSLVSEVSEEGQLNLGFRQGSLRFEKQAEAGGQFRDSLPSEEEQLSLGLRKYSPNEVRRVKLIDLDSPQEKTRVGLLIGVTPEDDGETLVRLQLRPTGRDRVLPEKIVLVTFSDSEKILTSDVADSETIYIESALKCSPGESFNVRIALGNCSATGVFHL